MDLPLFVDSGNDKNFLCWLIALLAALVVTREYSVAAMMAVYGSNTVSLSSKKHPHMSSFILHQKDIDGSGPPKRLFPKLSGFSPIFLACYNQQSVP